ncbi:hypothetical protein [Actinophytocola xanthii]|uniref:Uncharacterized protein n=1 Tax=Actinophytocola xanthii TaxID=1912961 RepID=A0A1Q8C2M8_9PSEU|nr:hypothetical protein [Actinophytocola xanthii]OLF08627.1 hypothetical protein BU204_34000 [Actinophytocola xanthii]
MSSKDTESIRISQIVAGALAAVTAALLGSTMGVAGTVVGAGLASVVSTVGGALYLRSLERTGESVRTVRDRVIARAGTTVVTVREEPPDDEPAGGGEEPERSTDPVAEQASHVRRRTPWPALVAGGVLAFLVGMVMVTGLEWVRGEPLSGGQGTTLSQIVRNAPAPADDREDRAPATQESTPPSEQDAPTEEPTGATTGTATPTVEPSDQPEEPESSGGASTPEQTPPTSTPAEEPTESAAVPPSGTVG